MHTKGENLYKAKIEEDILEDFNLCGDGIPKLEGFKIFM